MAIFPLALDQTIAQMWSNGARGGSIKHRAKVSYVRVAATGDGCCENILEHSLRSLIISWAFALQHKQNYYEPFSSEQNCI